MDGPRIRGRVAVWALGCALVIGIGLLGVWGWYELAEKRVRDVEPGRVVRGAWQRPGPLRRVIKREGIKTIITLTAINRDDPKYVAQARVVKETGVEWIIVPMRGSRATLEQMAEAADLVADPARQPVFFHCVAGHHRTSLVHAAYRMRHEGWSAEKAWREVSSLPWARPAHDAGDKRLIEAFAATMPRLANSRRSAHDGGEGGSAMVRARAGAAGAFAGRRDRLEDGDGQLRGRRAGSPLSIRTDEAPDAG